MNRDKLLDLATNAIRTRPFSSKKTRILVCTEGKIVVMGSALLPRESVTVMILTEDECVSGMDSKTWNIIVAKLEQLDKGGFICHKQ